MNGKRRLYSVSDELLNKSRESALSAIQIFNSPAMMFKSETYVVLMIIAWTYLLHSYYRKHGIEYRYYKQGKQRRVFDRTKAGAYKYWELERCLNDSSCPVDKDTANNLRFLILLRHEIEHQMTMRLDEFLGGRYQACAMNYNLYIKQLFGEKYAIDKFLTYSLQFMDLSYNQLSHADVKTLIPPRLQSLILEFDNSLSDAEFNSESYSYRLFFSRKLANRRGQADHVIEFIPPDSELAKQIEKEYWVKQPVEKAKFLPKQIVEAMKTKGHVGFSIHEHTMLWKTSDAKNPSKGYGTMILKTWYWYESWVNVVEKHCQDKSDYYSNPF
jgi:hypothetical protein